MVSIPILRNYIRVRIRRVWSSAQRLSSPFAGLRAVFFAGKDDTPGKIAPLLPWFGSAFGEDISLA